MRRNYYQPRPMPFHKAALTGALTGGVSVLCNAVAAFFVVAVGVIW